ncbi:MAG: mechanosensitive ion channel [Sphingobacteriales bacterium]|nr:mechanosensitive ion channel [Sphingobacteriales bacterium]
MNFLDHIYLDNSIKSYLAVGGTILVVLLLKKYLSRYLASLLHIAVSRIWSTVNKYEFLNLVIKPLEQFLLLLISVFAIEKLNFPQKLEFRIYHVESPLIVDTIGKGIIIIAFFGLMIRFIDFIALLLEKKAVLTDDKSDDQLIIFFRDFLKVIVTLGGILIVLKVCFNQHIGNLLTGLSIVGAAMALAAKESLENLIASFIIFFDKPFFTGDNLKVNGISGTVEKIGLRSTRIRTGDKTLVTVPNKQMVDSVVDNQSLRTSRRAEINLEFSIKTTLPIINNIINGIKEILNTNNEHIISSSVFLKEINKSGLTIITEYFTESFTQTEFDTLKQTINLAIKQLLEDNVIEMAGGTSTIIIDNNKIIHHD